MAINGSLLNTIIVPADQIKRTTLARSLFYDKLEIYDNRVVGFFEGQQTMSWYFKDYMGIDIVNANMNSQFAQVVFLTGMNSRNRAIGPDFAGTQNAMAMNDTNRILFCSGMFSFGKTNEFAMFVGTQVRSAFENFRNNEPEVTPVVAVSATSSADEILKFKTLLDSGIITAEEFEAKKRQLLGLEGAPQPQAPVIQQSSFCGNCGFKLPADAGNFCPNCGAKL